VSHEWLELSVCRNSQVNRTAPSPSKQIIGKEYLQLFKRHYTSLGEDKGGQQVMEALLIVVFIGVGIWFALRVLKKRRKSNYSYRWKDKQEQQREELKRIEGRIESMIGKRFCISPSAYDVFYDDPKKPKTEFRVRQKEGFKVIKCVHMTGKGKSPGNFFKVKFNSGKIGYMHGDTFLKLYESGYIRSEEMKADED